MSTFESVVSDCLAADRAAGTSTTTAVVAKDANENIGAVRATSLRLGTSGAETLVTATGAELNINDNAPADITFAPAAGGADVSEVTITVKDAAGVAIAKPFLLDVWLSDAATGAGLTSVTASGTVQAKAASGAVLQAVTAKKHLRVQTLATGIFILEITDSAKTGFRVCAVLPSNGDVKVSAALVAGNYGA